MKRVAIFVFVLLFVSAGFAQDYGDNDYPCQVELYAKATDGQKAR